MKKNRDFRLRPVEYDRITADEKVARIRLRARLWRTGMALLCNALQSSNLRFQKAQISLRPLRLCGKNDFFSVFSAFRR